MKRKIVKDKWSVSYLLTLLKVLQTIFLFLLFYKIIKFKIILSLYYSLYIFNIYGKFANVFNLIGYL